MQLDPVLELYGLPPEQFTAARNQLAKALRDAGDTRGSETVRALRKPTIAAWPANCLVRAVPDQIAELTEFGEDLREAHRLGHRTELKALTPRRHELVNHLVEVAKANAANDGRSITMSTAERLAATLDAALVDPMLPNCSGADASAWDCVTSDPAWWTRPAHRFASARPARTG